MVILSNFVERLEDLMFENNFSADDVSKKISLDCSTIYKYLNGKKLPSVETAIKLANLFNCSIEYLLGRTEQNHAQTFHEPPPFSQQLKFLLEYFKKSQYNLYTYGNFPQSAIQNWMKGKYTPTLDNIVKLAEYLDCTVDFVLGRERV